MDNNELTHYGVPGMKWGHRKSEDRVSRHQTRSSVAKSKQDYEKIQLERRKAQDAYKLNKAKEKLALTDHKIKQKMELEKLRQAKAQTKKIAEDSKRIDRKEKNDARERLAKIKQEIQTEKYLAKQEAKEAKEAEPETKKVAKRNMTKKVLIGVGVAAALVGTAYAVNKLKGSEFFKKGKEAAENSTKKIGSKKISDVNKDGFSSKIKDAFEKMRKKKVGRQSKDIYDVDFEDVTNSRTASKIAGLLGTPLSKGSTSGDSVVNDRIDELLRSMEKRKKRS